MPNAQAFKVPPHDVEAEKSVLGAILLDSSAFHLVSHFLRLEHFYLREHQVIYQSMLALYEKQQPMDIVTVKNELKSLGELKTIGGASYLSDVLNAVPTSAYIEYYAQIVKDRYIKRKLIEISSRTVDKAFSEEGDIKSLIDAIETDIYGIAQEHHHKEFIPLKEILTESFERIEKLSQDKNQYRGVPTGFRDLDEKLSGLMESNLIILAARPGVGKTTFALNIALHSAFQANKGVGMFSLEMSKEELVDRLLVSHADIDAWRLKTGRLTEDETRRLISSMGELSEANIFIDDTPGASIIEMRTKARRLKSEKNVGLIIVDYLQLANAGKKMESRVQEVSNISQGLKNLARELRVPVLALSQLSRAVEQRGSNRPQLADLRESGAIEQDADVVIFIYKENEDPDMVLDQNKRLIKLDVAKHRNGTTGEIDLMFRGDRVSFFNVEKS